MNLRSLVRRTAHGTATVPPKQSIPEGSALGRMLDDADLTLVDVGARGKPKAELRVLVPYSRIVAIEPDAEEARRLGQELPQVGWRDVVVVPKALAERPGDATLYVTARPGMSSLLPPDESVTHRYANDGAFRVVNRLPVTTETLASAASRHGFTDACYLKLDTQGTELHILQSGDDLVRSSVLGIFVETNFQPFYTDQPLFGDVDAYLRERGFMLVDMRKTAMRGRAYRNELYSKRQPLWAHCLYLRDPAWAFETGVGAVRRLAALALAYELFDLLLAIVEDPAGGMDLRRTYGDGLRDEIEAYARTATARRLRGLTQEDVDRTLARAERS